VVQPLGLDDDIGVGHQGPEGGLAVRRGAIQHNRSHADVEVEMPQRSLDAGHAVQEGRQAPQPAAARRLGAHHLAPDVGKGPGREHG